VTVNMDFALIPLSNACWAILAARVISSYELFVQLPIRPIHWIRRGRNVVVLQIKLTNTDIQWPLIFFCFFC
jgi:hypothetical protein